MRLITTMFVLCLLALGGCATALPTVMFKPVLILPPANLMLDCLVEPPPDKAVYLAASDKDREKMLIKLVDHQMKNTFVCNDRLAKLRLWSKEQEALYPTANAPNPGEK